MLCYVILYYNILYVVIYIYLFICPTYESALTMPPDILWCHVAYPSQRVSVLHTQVMRVCNEPTMAALAFPGRRSNQPFHGAQYYGRMFLSSRNVVSLCF